jgi:hypothetical protein
MQSIREPQFSGAQKNIWNKATKLWGWDHRYRKKWPNAHYLSRRIDSAADPFSRVTLFILNTTLAD